MVSRVFSVWTIVFCSFYNGGGKKPPPNPQSSIVKKIRTLRKEKILPFQSLKNNVKFSYYWKTCQ